VWQFLGERHEVPGPLALDEAVDRIASQLETNESLVPGPVESTVLELIGDAHQIGLRQDHVARLARIVSDDDEDIVRLLQHASDHLNWDTTDLREWEEVIDSVGSAAQRPISADTESPVPPSDTQFPEVQRAPGLAPVSLHQWTTQLAQDGLTSMPPLPDAPACSAVEVTGAGLDGRATTVYGRFEIAGRVEDLAYATNPLHWPLCSWFFISMIEQDASVALPPPDAVGGTAYKVDLEELVGFEDVLTVRTGLTTRYFVGTDSVGMEFDLTPGTHGDGKLDVDHGFLLAEKHPTEPGKLVITSQKTFSFVGLDDLPFSFLCEFGWIDMMRAMAQCRDPGG
jgi:hypothetical protein